MTKPTKPMKPTSEFDNFMDALVDELIAMPDDEVLEGQDPETVRAHGLKLLQAAKGQAGRRRLAAAKQGAAALKQRGANSDESRVDVVQARHYLSQVANNPRYTLAARGLEELSDEEVLSLYRQVKSLEASDEADGENR